MRFRRRIDDAFDPVIMQDTFDERLISDVAMNESIAGMSSKISRVGAIAGILERVQIHDRMSAVDNQSPDSMVDPRSPRRR